MEEEFDRGRSRGRAVDAQGRRPKMKRYEMFCILGVKGMEGRGCPGSGKTDREWIKKVFVSMRCLYYIPQTHESQASLLQEIRKIKYVLGKTACQ